MEEPNISKKLTALRKESGLTQQQVSDITNISIPLLSKYENGIINNPPQDQLLKLARVYNIEMYQYYTDQIKDSNNWKKRCEQLIEEVKLLRKTNDDLYNQLFDKK